MSVCCDLKSSSNEMEIKCAQIKAEIKRLANSTEAKFLIQDGKIAETCVYIKNNLSNAIRELLATMQMSGELDNIITSTILNNVQEQIDAMNVYYPDIITEKFYDSSSACYYYVTTVPSKYPLRLGLANGYQSENQNTCIGSGTNPANTESTIDFSHRKNATIAVNCGIYNTSTKFPVGAVIKDYRLLYDESVTDPKYQYLAIMSNGDIKTFPHNTGSQAMLAAGVMDACLIFGTLIENGISVPQSDERKDPRQSIGIKYNGDIMFITCDGRSRESSGMTYSDLVRLHAQYGSRNAYILDGGGSTSTVLRGIKQNENIDYFTDDRKVNNFLFVAKPTTISPVNESNNDLGNVKQELLSDIINKINFLNGYIRLIGPENYYAPGIELYVNNEKTRVSKIGLSYDSGNSRNTFGYFSLKAPGDSAEKTNLFRIYPQGVWVQVYHGTSAQRPNGVAGLMYFDESLKKPIWYTGTKWVDANGEDV